MEKINVAELLRNCPSGMELDCSMYDNLHFDKVDDYDKKIHCYIQYKDHRTHIMFGKDGTYNSEKASKCVIFPKGKTSWEGFVPPGQFKDGDVVISSLGHIHILKNPSTSYIFVNFVHNSNGSLCKSLTTCVNVIRLAAEEEKQKLFKAIKENGYKWNEETKTLEKLVEPKFKVGDSIQSVRVNLGNIYNVIEVKESSYVVNKNNENSNFHIDFDIQDDWELVPNKFDINTLVPFESRVLVRDNIDEEWHPAIWGYYDANTSYPYKTIGCLSRCCIPYEGNQHLLGTTDDCDEYFKTWK